jgi:hypothetical protein
MKRAMSVAFTMALLSIEPLLLAQENQSPLPSDVLGPQLIAWSQQQKPQPVPQPLPDPPSQHKDQQSAQPASPQAPQQPDVRTFTGKIVRDRSEYVLQVSDAVYHLDDQRKAQAYEGKDVKLVGILGEDSHSIRVSSIEIIS